MSAQQCLGVIIIPVLSVLLSALDVGCIPSLDCQTQCVSKVEGWTSKLLVGPRTISALPFPLSWLALGDGECRAVWPEHNRRPSSLNFAGQQTLTLWPPLFCHMISLETKTKTHWMTPPLIPSSSTATLSHPTPLFWTICILEDPIFLQGLLFWATVSTCLSLLAFVKHKINYFSSLQKVSESNPQSGSYHHGWSYLLVFILS